MKRFEAMHFPVGRAIPRVGEKALPTLTLPVDGEGIASLSGLFANGSGIGPSTARGGRRREVGEHVSTPPKLAGCAKPAVDSWGGSVWAMPGRLSPSIRIGMIPKARSIYVISTWRHAQY